MKKDSITMRDIYNALVKELGFNDGYETFNWYCYVYKVTIDNKAPNDIIWEVFGI